METTSQSRSSTCTWPGFPLQTTEGIQIEFYVAAGFALEPAAENMICSSQASASIVDLCLKMGKDVVIGNNTLPVSAIPGFDPSINQASTQIALNLF